MGAEVTNLKQTLLREVCALSRNDGSIWKGPILDVLSELRQSSAHAVLFGGTLRSLLTARLFYGKRGRPRDIDVVVAGAPIADLEERFGATLNRRTRFGGLQLKRGGWQFDVWPVGDTWAFKHDQTADASFAELPSTTTFNLEAIAVEAWPTTGRSRALFSGDDQFFDGILSRTLELNRDDSPFPELTVLRGLVMASELRFKIGPRFAQYVRDFGYTLSQERFDEIQCAHYGYSRMDSRTLTLLVSQVLMTSSDGRNVSLPDVGQLHLWKSGSADPTSKLSVHLVGPQR
jgi:hypothetical protein